jgi:hypothetical protein
MSCWPDDTNNLTLDEIVHTEALCFVTGDFYFFLKKIKIKQKISARFEKLVLFSTDY